MTFLKFPQAKALMRLICQKKGLKTVEDWIKFANSKEFKKFEKLIPRKPEVYYSKANVMKRLQKKANRLKIREAVQQ